MKDDSSEAPVEKPRQKKRADLVGSHNEKDLFCVRSCPFCFSGDWGDYDCIALSMCLHKLY
jgi:hypothetical protein